MEEEFGSSNIQTDFHKKYSVEKMIGKGSFARVSSFAKNRYIWFRESMMDRDLL